jgi:hypothetical protein
MAARRRKSRRLGSLKVCKVVRGKLKCSSLKGLAGRRRRSHAMGAMPKRNSKGRFIKRR